MSIVPQEHSIKITEKNLKEMSKDSVRKKKLNWHKAGHTTREHKDRFNVRTVSWEIK